MNDFVCVMPGTGIGLSVDAFFKVWIPAFAGMTT
jgi:hypothetical protein